MKAIHIKTMPAKKRMLLLVVSLCLVVTMTVSGTFAYIWYKAANSATNTFKGTDLTITFGNASESQRMVPGEHVTIPSVTIASGSIPCYLFVRLSTSNTTSRDTYLTIPWNTSFTHCSTTGNDIYYYLKTSSTGSFNAFTNGRITIKDTVTKEALASVSDFTINIQYCAVQQSESLTTVAQAFSQCSWS